METDHESIAAQGWLVGPRPCSQQPELNAEARANSLDMHKKTREAGVSLNLQV